MIEVFHYEVVDIDGLEGAIGHADIDFALLVAHLVEGLGVALVAVLAFYLFDEDVGRDVLQIIAHLSARLEVIVSHAQVDGLAVAARGLDGVLYAREVLLHGCNYLGLGEVVLIDNIGLWHDIVIFLGE